MRGLQTVATYDPATQEFILNTPTLQVRAVLSRQCPLAATRARVCVRPPQSMKWWNSNIGLAATHAAVYAQLVLGGARAAAAHGPSARASGAPG